MRNVAVHDAGDPSPVTLVREALACGDTAQARMTASSSCPCGVCHGWGR